MNKKKLKDKLKEPSAHTYCPSASVTLARSAPPSLQSSIRRHSEWPLAAVNKKHSNLSKSHRKARCTSQFTHTRSLYLQHEEGPICCGALRAGKMLIGRAAALRSENVLFERPRTTQSAPPGHRHPHTLQTQLTRWHIPSDLTPPESKRRVEVISANFSSLYLYLLDEQGAVPCRIKKYVLISIAADFYTLSKHNLTFCTYRQV